MIEFRIGGMGTVLWASSFILAQKLKALKVVLKKWNREEFGNLTFRKNLLTELMGLDAREELLGSLSTEDQNHRIQIKGDILLGNSYFP